MKKLIFVFTFLAMGLFVLSQPTAFRYQTVVRDASGNILSNQQVSFRINILKASTSGTNVYTETHIKTTNQFGLASLEIGNGSVISGNFNTINWGNDNYYLKVEIDETGGGSYQFMGTSQLLSVPYALYSENTANTDDADADPTNEFNTDMTLTGNSLEVTDAGGTLSVALGSLSGDSDWTISGNNMYSGVTGNVGIGTTSPGAKLDVTGPSAGLAANIRTFGDIHLGYGSASGGGLYFGTNSYSWATGDYIRQPGVGKIDILAGGTSGTQLILDNSFNGTKIINNEDAWLRIGADNDNSGGDDGTQNAYLQFTTDGGNENYDGLIWLENLNQDTKLHFNVADQEAMTIYNGNIGIGINNPNKKLYIREDLPGLTYSLKIDNSNSSSGSAVGVLFSAGGGGIYRGKGALVYNITDTWNRGSFQFLQDKNANTDNPDLDDAVLTIDNSGRVGIGTTSPEVKLDVNGNSSLINTINCFSKIHALVGKAFIDIRVGAGSNPEIWTIENQSGDLKFNSTKYSTLEAMTLTDQGYLGIGTTTPTEKLDVAGIIKANNLIVEELSLESSSDAYFSVKRGTNNNGGITFFEEGTTGGQWIFPFFRGWQSNNIIVRDDVHGRDVMTFEFNTGNVGIGVSNPSHRLDINGNLGIYDGSNLVVELGAGLDYAEGFNVSEEQEVAPGTVLIIDPKNPGKLKISTEAYDSKVAGIVAGANGLGSGIKLGVGSFDCNVALAGRVYCNVDAADKEINPGDMLTSSAIPGYAMKVINIDKARGAIIGKAMEGLKKGEKGQILVLVTLQ